MLNIGAHNIMSSYKNEFLQWLNLSSVITIYTYLYKAISKEAFFSYCYSYLFSFYKNTFH